MPQYFLNSPLGITCLVIISVTSLFNIYAHWLEDGLIGRLLYMATALTCVAGLVRYIDATIPEHIANTLIVLFAVKGVRNVCVRSARYFKYRKAIHAKKHI